MEPWVYVVILGAAVVGYALMKPNRPAEAGGAAVSDIETALNQFALELEDDNRELLQSVAGIKRELEAEINKLNGRVEALEKQSSRFEANSLQLAAQERLANQAGADVQRTQLQQAEEADVVAVPVAEPNIKTRYNFIFELYDQGKSIEYIAKKNGMNKGEVQLIIQLAKQEEKFRD